MRTTLKALTQIRRISILLGLLLALFAQVGCRVGNHSNAPAPITSPAPAAKETPKDQTSGYYQTSVFRVDQIITKPEASRKTLPLVKIPPWIKNLVSNPVAIAIDDQSTDMVLFANAYGSGDYLEMAYDQTQSAIMYLGSTNEEMLWTDPACVTQRRVSIDGTYQRAATPFLMEGFSKKVHGKVSLSFIDLRTFVGDCTPSLEAMRDCYLDSSKCDGKDESENLKLKDLIVSILGPYIDSGIISASNIPTLSSVAYEILFQ